MFSLSAVLVRRINHINKIHPLLYTHLQRRLNSTDNRSQITTSSKSGSEVDTDVKPLGERVKENTKTASNLVVILIGLGVTSALVSAIFRELFSSSSPANIYSNAAKKCTENNQVTDKLGYPVTAYGEETRRRRRTHASHAFYVDKEGRKHIRMKFHLKGSAGFTGLATLDMVETGSGYEYRYLFVEVNDMFKTVIVIEDNRKQLDSPSQSGDLDLQF